MENKLKKSFGKIVVLVTLLLFSISSFGQSVTASNKQNFSSITVTNCGNNIWKVKAYQANQWAEGAISIYYGGTIIGSCCVNCGCWNNSLKYTTNQFWSASNDGSFAMSGHAGRWVYIEVNTTNKTANTQSTDFTCSSCTQPTAPTSITGTTTICSGGTTTLTATGGSDGSSATYQWGTGSTVGGGTILQNSTSTTYTTAALTANQTYWVRRIGTTTGCTNTTGGVTATVTVNAVPTISGTNSVCVGSTTTLTPSLTGGTWTSSNTSVATINTSGVVTGVSGGTSTITYTLNGCSSTMSVTVNAVPTISGTNTICVGSTTTLTPSLTGGTWTSSNTGVATINASGVVTGVSGGTSTITYTLNGCSRTMLITVNVVPTLSGTNTICVGSTTTLTPSVGGGTWTSSNTGVATINTSGVVTGVSGGTSTISYTLNGCSSTMSVTVSPTSVGGSISGSSSICSGTNSTTLTLSGHTGNVIRWESSTSSTFGSGVTNITNTTTTLTATNLTTTTYYRAVIQSGVCSTVNSTNGTITVNPVPTISGTNSVCVGSTTTLTPSLTGGTWTSSNTGVATINASGVVTGVSGGTSTITYTLNGCSSTMSVTINVVPTISGTNSVCVGSTTTLTPSLTGGTWTSSNTGVATINASGVVTGVSGGTSTITYTLNGCSSTYNITVSPTSVGGSISGSSSVCSGTNSTTLTLSGHTGNIIRWESSTSSGFSSTTNITNTTNTLTATNLTTTTYYRAVIQSGVCSTSNSSIATIEVSPITVSGTISGSSTVCYGSNSGNLTLSGNTGSVVKWQNSIDGGSTWNDISNTTTTQSYTNLVTTTQYRAVVQSGSCSSTNTSPVTISVYNELIPGTISSNQIICSNVVPDSILSITFPTGGTGTYTYQWQSSTDNIIWNNITGATSLNYLPGSLSTSTYYRLATTSGSCGTTYTTPTFIKVNTCNGPGGVSNDITLWLKADQGVVGTTTVTLWEDQSGNEKHATRDLGSPSKKSIGKNFQPSISFDGNSGFVTDSITIEHMFIVVQPSETSSTNDFQIIGRKNHRSSNEARVLGFGNRTIKSTSDSSTFATVDRIRINGKTNVSLSTTKANIISVDNENKGRLKDVYKLGQKSNGTNYENLNGDISEIICFSSKKTGIELAKIESYLSVKYGITISNDGGVVNGNYYNVNGDVIWNASDNSSYHNDVIAIGKDNANELIQKQSKTNDDKLTVFISDLKNSNLDNTGTITNNGSYIVIGHNRGNLKSDSIIDLESPSEIKHRLAREWKITNTNFGNNFNLEIEWDSSGVFDLSKVRLLVDDDGDFTNAYVYGPDDGLRFRLGSIIIEDINSSFVPTGSTKYITIGSIDELTVLPIDLLSFYGTKNKSTVDINWSTGSEINVDYYGVLHSIDGIDYKIIGTVGSGKNSNIKQDYSLTHYSPVNGINYYKLVEYDLSGYVHSHGVIYVNFDVFDDGYKFILYPNPIGFDNNLYLKTNYTGDIEVHIFDIKGSLIYKNILNSGIQYNILLNNLSVSNGVYNVVISSPSNVFESKIIRIIK